MCLLSGIVVQDNVKWEQIIGESLFYNFLFEK